MTNCWKCEAPTSGLWDHCQRCGALSTANVEAVCRGVASCAVSLELFDCPQATGETLVEARIVDEGWTAVHPTCHGAAFAAFDAAWKAGVERLTDGVRVYRELWPEHDAETIRQWCEETGAAWTSAAGYAALHFADGSLLGVRPGKVLRGNGRWLQYCDPAQWMGLRLWYSRVPDHVADAMVREAKRALGAES